MENEIREKLNAGEIVVFEEDRPSGLGSIAEEIVDYDFEARGKGVCHILGGGFDKDVLKKRCREDAKSQAIEMAKKMGANIVVISQITTGDVYTTNKNTGRCWHDIAHIANFNACLYKCEKLEIEKKPKKYERDFDDLDDDFDIEAEREFRAAMRGLFSNGFDTPYGREYKREFIEKHGFWDV